MTDQCSLNIVVAHKLEAKPLIDLLELQQDYDSNSYKIYRNGKGICLIIAGMGKLAAASATASLAASQATAERSPAAWLNLGIAGHQSAAIGDGLLAHKITERATGTSFYPPQLFDGFKTSNIITVDEPEQEYPDDAAYEMEAFGFYSAATRFVTSELVQVYKIVSDNPTNPVAEINPDLVSSLVMNQAEEIVRLTNELIELADKYHQIYRLPVEFDELKSKARLSVTQVSQLKRLCQRYHALGHAARLQSLVKQSHSSGKQLVRVLEKGLLNDHHGD